jgi:hypothetical protein
MDKRWGSFIRVFLVSAFAQVLLILLFRRLGDLPYYPFVSLSIWLGGHSEAVVIFRGLVMGIVTYSALTTCIAALLRKKRTSSH